MDCPAQTTTADTYLKEIRTCGTWDDYLILKKKFDEFVLTLNAKNDEIKTLFNAHGIKEHIPVSIETYWEEIFGVFGEINYLANAPCICCSATPQNVSIANTYCQFQQSCLCSKEPYPVCSKCISEQIGDEVTCQIPCKTCKGTFCLFGLTHAQMHYHNNSVPQEFLPDFGDGVGINNDQFMFQPLDELIPPPPQVIEQPALSPPQPVLLPPQFEQQREPLHPQYEYEVLESGTAPDVFYPELFDRLMDPKTTPIEKIEARLRDMQQILIVFGQRINRGTQNEKLLVRASDLIIDMFKDLNYLAVPEPRVIEELVSTKLPGKKLESDVKKRTRIYTCKVCGKKNPGHYEKKCPGPTLASLAEIASQKKKLNPHYPYDDGED